MIHQRLCNYTLEIETYFLLISAAVAIEYIYINDLPKSTNSYQMKI